VYFTCAPSIGLAVRDSVYLFVLKFLGVPTVAHLHGGNIEGFFGGNAIRRRVVRSALRTCRNIIVITREVENVALEIFGPGLVKYLPNMIDDNVLEQQSDSVRNQRLDGRPLRLLHVGWQSSAKGSLDLIEALRYVSQDVSCELVGVAAEENRKLIETRITELGLARRVKMTGEKTGRDLADAFSGADIFVFPSHYEGFPMVVLEAMACGLPIIATDVGNIGEIIGSTGDNPCGLLLRRKNPADPRELAYLIDKLAEDPLMRRKFGDNGRLQIRRHYLASIVVPEIERFLTGLCNTAPLADIKTNKLSEL
jgi:glycosyltransferase involved in cell wall biosynthesis